jgi:hypothetical protein
MAFTIDMNAWSSSERPSGGSTRRSRTSPRHCRSLSGSGLGERHRVHQRPALRLVRGEPDYVHPVAALPQERQLLRGAEELAGRPPAGGVSAVQHPGELEVLRELDVHLGLYVNFVPPQMKLVEKTREEPRCANALTPPAGRTSGCWPLPCLPGGKEALTGTSRGLNLRAQAEDHQVPGRAHRPRQAQARRHERRWATAGSPLKANYSRKEVSRTSSPLRGRS